MGAGKALFHNCSLYTQICTCLLSVLITWISRELWRLSWHIKQTDSFWIIPPLPLLSKALPPPPPSLAAILFRYEDHWRGKISSSGPARIYSCFGVSSEISALCQTMSQALHLHSHRITSMTTSLLSPHWKVREMWRWGWCSLRPHFSHVRQRERERRGGNGGGVSVDDTSAPITFVLSQRKNPEGKLWHIFEGGHVCVCGRVYVCASVFCCHGFNISPNLSNRNRHLGREMDGTHNLKHNHSKGIWTKCSMCAFVSE